MTKSVMRVCNNTTKCKKQCPENEVPKGWMILITKSVFIGREGVTPHRRDIKGDLDFCSRDCLSHYFFWLVSGDS